MSIIGQSRRDWSALRGWLDGIAAIAMVITAASILWVIMRGTPATPAASARPPIAVPTELVSLEGAPLLGDGSAKVVIIEFSDFQCPFCAKFSQETFPALKNQYVDKALVKFAFRHLPLTRIHPRAWQAAEAAECGARQSKFWTMHDQLFANPSRLEETDLRTYARSSGLDLRLFNSCLAGEARDRVTWDSQSAQTLKISGTPSLLIGVLQSDGRVKVQHVLSGAAPLAEFAKALDPLLKQARLANRRDSLARNGS